MNSIVIDGRVVRDAEYKEVGANGTPLLEFTLANDTGYGEYKKTHFFKCKVWGKRATGLASHIVKGKPLTVRGEMQMQQWQGDDGKNRYSWDINIGELNFHMKDSTSGPSQQTYPAGDTQRDTPISKPPAFPSPGQQFDDDIPF